jgi:hypothetical protein
VAKVFHQLAAPRINIVNRTIAVIVQAVADLVRNAGISAANDLAALTDSCAGGTDV